MPTTHEAIEKHKRRVSYLNYMLSDKLDIDSLTNVKLPTSMKRGTIITRICSKDENTIISTLTLPPQQVHFLMLQDTRKKTLHIKTFH